MDIEIFTLCDSAQDYQGKLMVIGTFNRIASPVFPLTYPIMAIAGRVGFSREEYGLHAFIISITKEDGTYLLGPIDGNVDNSKNIEEYDCVNLVLTVNTIVFPEPGKYFVNLNFAGKIHRKIPLFVTYPPENNQIKQ